MQVMKIPLGISIGPSDKVDDDVIFTRSEVEALLLGTDGAFRLALSKKRHANGFPLLHLSDEELSSIRRQLARLLNEA